MTERTPHPVALRALRHFDSLFPDEDVEPVTREAFALNDPSGASPRKHGAPIFEVMQTLPAPNFTKRYREVSESKAGGVTYTPRELADFVADQIIQVADLPSNRPVRVLDPAVGEGELLHSLLARISRPVEVYGFETDAAALKTARSRLAESFPLARVNLVEGSFLDHVLGQCSDGLFATGDRYDLIIANPPYVRTQIIGAEGARRLASQFGLAGRVDLYFAFLLGIARVLLPSGSAGIIVSNRFMTTRAGGIIRKKLTGSLNLQSIFDLGDTKLFDAAVLPAVIIANGRDAAEATAPARFTSIYESKTKCADQEAKSPIAALERSGLVSLPDGRTFEVQHGTLHNDTDPAGVWRLSSDDVSAWLETVQTHTWARFRNIGKVRVGVKSTADSVFIQKDWPEPLELLRPLTTHEIARRFRADPSRHAKQILYPHDVVNGRRVAVDLDAFPASRAYLEAHRAKLERRSYVIESGRKWYEIWVPQQPDDWVGPKLVFRDICEQPTFWIDRDDTIVNGDCYWLKPFAGMEEALWLALAVANSTFTERFYDIRFNNKLYAGRRRFITQYVDEFPIPDPTSATGNAIIMKTKRLFDLVGEASAAELERELDELVWQAFGLAIEEV